MSILNIFHHYEFFHYALLINAIGENVNSVQIKNIKMVTEKSNTQIPNIISTKFKTVSQATSWKPGDMSKTQGSVQTAHFTISPDKSVEDLKKILIGEPFYYQLADIQVYNLSGDYEKVLRNFATQVGINNILIDSQYPGYLRLKYANSYTDQETKANYVLLKCWNENTIPYMIHSNYITVKSPKDKIFIWTRRKNNIFDLKIENLGEE